MIPEVGHDEAGCIKYHADDEVDPEIESVSLVGHHLSACADESALHCPRG